MEGIITKAIKEHSRIKNIDIRIAVIQAYLASPAFLIDISKKSLRRRLGNIV